MQVTLCDPYLSALSVRYFNKGAIINPLPLPLQGSARNAAKVVVTQKRLTPQDCVEFLQNDSESLDEELHVLIFGRDRSDPVWPKTVAILAIKTTDVMLSCS